MHYIYNTNFADSRMVFLSGFVFLNQFILVFSLFFYLKIMIFCLSANIETDGFYLNSRIVLKVGKKNSRHFGKYRLFIISRKGKKNHFTKVKLISHAHDSYLSQVRMKRRHFHNHHPSRLIIHINFNRI